MTLHPDSAPDSITAVSAVHVEKLSFRYRSLDDDSQPKSAANASAESLDQPQIIEDISFSLLAGELLLIAGPRTPVK